MLAFSTLGALTLIRCCDVTQMKSCAEGAPALDKKK